VVKPDYQVFSGRLSLKKKLKRGKGTQTLFNPT